MEFIENDALMPALDCMKGITPDTISPGSVPSFCVNQVSPGDLLWTPCAYLFVEKAVNANSIALRATWHRKDSNSLLCLWGLE